MIKKVTVKWLKKWDACKDGIEWFERQEETDPGKLIGKLIGIKEYSYINYSLVQLLNRKQKIEYAIYAAQQIIEIYEKEYPEDDGPRKTLETAKLYIYKNTEKSRLAVVDAAGDASKAPKDFKWGANGLAGAAAMAAKDAVWAAGGRWGATKAAWAAAITTGNALGAARAAWSARNGAWAAVDAARAAVWAAGDIAKTAGAAWGVSKAAMQKKIISHGITLLEEK